MRFFSTQVNISIKETKTETIVHSNHAMFNAQNEYISPFISLSLIAES